MQRQAAHLSRFDVRFRFKWPLYLAMGLGALLIPPPLSRLNPPILYSAEYSNVPPLDLFVFLATGAWCVIAYLELKDRTDQSLRQLLPVVTPLLLALHVLVIFKQYSDRSWDYYCFENGAKAVVAGTALYSDCYLYWPLLAQAMASLYSTLAWVLFSVRGRPVSDPALVWDLLFYFYQCMQFCMVLVAYFLLHRFAIRLTLDRALAAILIAVLFVFSNSFYATLNFNQMGLLLLNLCLLAILLLPSHPILSGLLVAVGGHIKIYPYILLAPWTLKRHWRAIAALIAGSVAILLVQTRGGQDWELWQQYLAMAKFFPVGTLFRDNSVQNIVHNTLRELGYAFHFDGNQYAGISDALTLLLSLAAFGWWLWRYMVRERAARLAAFAATAPADRERYAQWAMYGHSAEALVFALLISPIVWEHHYVFALPLAVWAIAVAGRQRPWLIAIALILMMGLPTFNVYPFSYHRIAGLVLLLVITSPRALPALAAAPERESTSAAGLELGARRHDRVV